MKNKYLVLMTYWLVVLMLLLTVGFGAYMTRQMLEM